MQSPITCCRICGSEQLESILDLGVQALTGVFPTVANASGVGRGPLELVLCSGDSSCGLVQLRHSFPAHEMYGETYGYRSGLNQTMIAHLRKVADNAKKFVSLAEGDTIIDIGSNDGTLLGFFSEDLNLIGIDPSANKFGGFYRKDIKRIPDFFSAELVEPYLSTGGAKVITSIAMMYDLEDPVDFARQVSRCLARDGVWIFEQSYLPTMVTNLAYDTVCHEHIEYYGIRQIDWMLREAGLGIIDVEFNLSNGGSVAVVASHAETAASMSATDVQSIIKDEIASGFSERGIFDNFAKRVLENRSQIRQQFDLWSDQGLKICGLGASTKGNVLLQFIGATPKDIVCIGDVNPDKHGRVTPGTEIPIVSEQECLGQNPDILVVLPWHFASFFESVPQFKGRKLFFPLPHPRLVHL